MGGVVVLVASTLMVIRRSARKEEAEAAVRRKEFADKASEDVSNMNTDAGPSSSVPKDSLPPSEEESSLVVIPQLVDWAADLLSWRDHTRSGGSAALCAYGLFFSLTYRWSFSSIVAHCLLLRVMYKCLVHTLVFTGVKNK